MLKLFTLLKIILICHTYNYGFNVIRYTYVHRRRCLRARGAGGLKPPLNFQVVIFFKFFFIFYLLKQCCQPTEPELRCIKTGVGGGGEDDERK